MKRAPASILSRVRIVLATVVLLACAAASAAAATVTLTWAPNPEPDIAGYVVYYGTSSGLYSTSVDVGSQTSFQFVEPDSTTRYYFAVSAYNVSGARSELSAEVSTDPTSLQLTGVSSSLPAPQAAGTSIVFSAATSGALTPPEYKWLVSDGSTWTTQQSWSTSNTFTWKPSVANANYTVAVWVRNGGSTIDSPSPSLTAYIPFQILQPLALTALSASLAPPQLAGTSITFAASATGGTAPYQYKWLVFNGSTWSVAQQWSSSNSFVWTPSSPNVNYSIGVWVRSATNTADAPENTNAGSTMPFAITASTKVAVTSLTANKSAPQVLGSKVLFTATANGASSFEFKWWVWNGTIWAIAQEWSPNNKFMWAPATPNAGYQVLVRARDAANSSESDGASMPFAIISATGKGRK